ncbi:glyoxalase domain-containing protein 4-like [Tropilaelaps mercedesae]|uniref:Glyoxalase domain-containing protein 4-like n=1 Tax=Tropilaelaps mercedesae TaxID=418985 RepID=A0A1V9X4C0_9ACAR|nr:glyoxalase domain-containing protein 4-like [Tropilaelaps mercedesae]
MASNAAHLRRALHYVCKVPDRSLAIKFYTQILGMRVLRHEEFETGCQAACNGRYDGFWSKTMVGYGSEDDHFVMELTYNYGVNSYKMGNDFRGILIQSDEILKRAALHKCPVELEKGRTYLKSPGGYKFYVDNLKSEGDPVKQVIYNCTNLAKTRRFWEDILWCEVLDSGDDFLEVTYDKSKTSLRFEKIIEPIDRAEAYGRVAFSCPRGQLEDIESQVKNSNLGVVITPLVTLPTPNKPPVEVVILGDPDGHEICFVGDEAFRELSKEDPKSERMLEEKMAEYDAFIKKTAATGRRF